VGLRFFSIGCLSTQGGLRMTTHIFIVNNTHGSVYILIKKITRNTSTKNKANHESKRKLLTSNAKRSTTKEEKHEPK